MRVSSALARLCAALSKATAPAFAAVPILLFASLAAAQQATSADLFDPQKAELLLASGSIKQSGTKFPASVPLILWLKNCDLSDPTRTFPPGSTYDIVAGGPGLAVTGTPVASGCRLTATLTIDSTAASPGYFPVFVTETAGTPPTHRDRGHAVLPLLASTAGPTPANPQVDVIWGVLSKDLCSDNFGPHVADDLYCVEVKIGNNTGYTIQLAGVGFKFGQALLGSDVTLPNASYESVRASAQSFQLRSPRNLFVNGAEATGILMAAFNPFFLLAKNQLKWAVGTSVIGTLLPSAADKISPDPTLKQLNNLDDQTFRDGKLIPNNTQIRTMVFVEKRSLVESERHLFWRTTYRYSNLLKAACDKLYPPTKAGESSLDAVNCATGGDNPTAVKLALGQLVIVGDEINYIQRVVVDSNVTSQEVNPTPDIVSLALNGQQIEAGVSGLSTDFAKVSAVILAAASGDPTSNLPLDLDTTQSNANKLVFTVKGQTLAPDATKTLTIQFTLPNGQLVQKTLPATASAPAPAATPASSPATQPSAPPTGTAPATPGSNQPAPPTTTQKPK